MTKTLADMTADERQQCVGMWCEWGGGLRIIGQIFAPHATFCGLVRPNVRGLPLTADLELVTPRFDLMRAWNPDGTPVEMHIETDYVEYGIAFGGGSKRLSFPEGTKVRRPVGEWEETK